MLYPIILTSDKDILSYADNDVAILTAKVKTSSGGIPVGIDVVFKKDGVLLDTVQTNTQGVATYSYSSTGAGDITFSAECDLVSETYGISDCTIARPTEQSLTGTSSTKVHSLNIDSIGDLSNTNFELAFKFKMTQDYGGVLSIGASNEWSTSPTKANYRLSLGSDSQSETKKRYAGVRTTSTNNVYGSAISSNTYYDCKIVRNGNDVSFYFDGTSFGSKTQSFFEDYSDFSIYGITWRYCSIAVKDITLKPL